MNISGNLTVGSNITASGALTIDTINENTTNNGVVIEGVTINNGNVTAAKFIGDGSQLTGINASGGSVVESNGGFKSLTTDTNVGTNSI